MDIRVWWFPVLAQSSRCRSWCGSRSQPTSMRASMCTNSRPSCLRKAHLTLAKDTQQQLKQYLTNISVPDYREDEVLRKLTGIGVFDLRINPATGETTGVRILKSTGHSELDASALKALINWRFKPGTLIRAIFPFMFAHFRGDWPVTPGAFIDRDYLLRPPH